MNMTWRHLNEILNNQNEETVYTMLSNERENRRSLRIMSRLHQRYSALRTIRERIEITNEALIP